jgi:SAM-dependent methyltransferase
VRHLAECTPVPEVYFNERVAERYDAEFADMFVPAIVDPAVSFLADLAGDGAALELGIGTGRIALPLSQRGVRVHGIDLSAAMIARLRAKPGAAGIEVTVGDFATTRVGGEFRLAYLIFNTIMGLATQDDQVNCFRNVAAQLEPGGCFVIEVMVPELRRLPPGQNVVPFQATQTGWGYDVYDVVSQAVTANYVDITDGRGEHTTYPGRYVWPAELDLMAQLAGMTLRERWGGWGREPFTSESTEHVSVWTTEG